MTAPAIQLQGVSKRFGPLVALDGVSLAIQPGEFVLVAGPNGAGKSTLVRLLSGLSQPTRGRVLISGQEPRNASARQAVGLVSHQPLLYDDLSARENLDFFARMYGVPPRDRVDTLIVERGIGPFQHRRVRELSRGMKQRLALARAMVQSPELLFLDEPFEALDRDGSVDLLLQLEKFKGRGKTVVVIAHRLEELAGLVTRLVLLRAGRLQRSSPWEGDARQLRAACTV